MISALLSLFGGKLIALLAGGVAALGLYFKVRAQGAAAERQKTEQANADFLEAKHNRDVGLDRLSDAELDQRLLDHSYKPSRGRVD